MSSQQQQQPRKRFMYTPETTTLSSDDDDDSDDASKYFDSPLVSIMKKKKRNLSPPSVVPASSSNQSSSASSSSLNGDHQTPPTNEFYKIKLANSYECKFPYKPYDTQVEFMNRIIHTLDNQKFNAILESPTGTGKTLSLLCATLCWQQYHKAKIIQKYKNLSLNNSNNTVDSSKLSKILNYLEKGFTNKAENEILKMENFPKIIYCCRTHSQIKQVIKELKQTFYKPKMTILGSKQYYCINKKIKNMNNINNECQKLIDNLSCEYYKNVDNLVNNSDFSSNGKYEIFDIEDLLREGKKLNSCPYYTSKEWLNNIQIEFIICPYNYVLDSITRNSINLNLENNILILDEAHNIEDLCRESSSLDLIQSDIGLVVNELFQLFNSHNILVQQTQNIHNFLNLLNNFITKQDLNNDFSNESPNYYFNNKFLKLNDQEFKIIRNVNEIKSFLNQVKFTNVIKDQVHQLISYSQLPMNKKRDPMVLSIKSQNLLMELVTIFDYLYNSTQNYAIVISNINNGLNNDRKLNIWCLSPSVAFKEIAKNSKSIILASGTLSPIETFSSELNTEFKTIYESNHIIKPNQIFVGTIGNVNNISLNANHQNSNSPKYQDELGNVIINLCKNIKDGVLLFFPSYSFLDKILNRWKINILNSIKKYKQIFYEEKGLPIEETISKYNKCIDNGNGAIFIGICRGKVSEGIDFKDNKCRAVICVGIPFPNITNLQINLKKQFNDFNISNNTNVNNSAMLTGEEWYSSQAFRALNQAVGRCIRHSKDFGAIILIDERYQKNLNLIQYFSKWIRSNIKHYYDLNNMVLDLNTFFNQFYKNTSISTSKNTPNNTNMLTNNDINNESDESLEILSSDDDEIIYNKNTPTLTSKSTITKNNSTKLTNNTNNSNTTNNSNNNNITASSNKSNISNNNCKECELINGEITNKVSIKDKILLKLIISALNKSYSQEYIYKYNNTDNKITSHTNLNIKNYFNSVTIEEFIYKNNNEIFTKYLHSEGLVYQLLFCNECKNCCGVKVLATNENEFYQINNIYLFAKSISTNKDKSLQSSKYSKSSNDDVCVISSDED